jgi:hypothetical protein
MSSHAGYAQANLGDADLANIMPRLAAELGLISLELQGNAITRLPPPAVFSALRAIQFLDLEANPLENVHAVIASLQALPALRELRITLSDEDEEVRERRE